MYICTPLTAQLFTTSYGEKSSLIVLIFVIKKEFKNILLKVAGVKKGVIFAAA